MIFALDIVFFDEQVPFFTISSYKILRQSYMFDGACIELCVNLFYSYAKYFSW
jgi:hypothetical protein